MVGINTDLTSTFKGKACRIARVDESEVVCGLNISKLVVRFVGMNDHASIDGSFRHILVAVTGVTVMAGVFAVQMNEKTIAHITGSVGAIYAANAFLCENFIIRVGVAIVVGGSIEYVLFTFGGNCPAEVQGALVEKVFVHIERHAVIRYLHGIPDDGFKRLLTGFAVAEKATEYARCGHNGEGSADEQQHCGYEAYCTTNIVSVFSLRMQHIHDLLSRPLLESGVRRNGIEELSVIILQHHFTSVSVSRDFNRSRPRFICERTVELFSPSIFAISSVESCS